MNRRALLLASGLAGCGGREPPPPPLRPIGYRYLTPLPLAVASIETRVTAPAPAPSDPAARLDPGPAEAVLIMGRDRLLAVGGAPVGVFTATRGSLTRLGSGLVCSVGCRLEIIAGERLGAIEAEARATATGSEAARPAAAEQLLRRAMDDLNVEFEYQLRRTLRTWLVEVAPGSTGVPAPAPGGVAREDLPRS